MKFSNCYTLSEVEKICEPFLDRISFITFLKELKVDVPYFILMNSTTNNDKDSANEVVSLIEVNKESALEMHAMHRGHWIEFFASFIPSEGDQNRVNKKYSLIPQVWLTKNGVNKILHHALRYHHENRMFF